MTSYVLAIPEAELLYPLTQQALRAAYPTTLLPEGFAGLEELYVFPVAETSQPEYDPQIEEVIEGTPEFTGGVWLQTWDVVELETPVYSANWRGFTQALQAKDYFIAAMADSGQAGVATSLITVLLAQLSNAGNTVAIQAAVNAFVAATALDAAGADRDDFEALIVAPYLPLTLPALAVV